MRKNIFFLLIFLSMPLFTTMAQERFSITLTVDSAIASQPQQVYLYSQVEREMTLHH